MTGITGTYGGEAITGVLPVNTVSGNDNLIFYPGTPYLDVSGLGFSVAMDPGGYYGKEMNVYPDGPNGYTDNGPTDYNPLNSL